MSSMDLPRNPYHCDKCQRCLRKVYKDAHRKLRMERLQRYGIAAQRSSQLLDAPSTSSENTASSMRSTSSDSIASSTPATSDYIASSTPSTSDYIASSALSTSDYIASSTPSTSDYIASSTPSTSDNIASSTPSTSSDNTASSTQSTSCSPMVPPPSLTLPVTSPMVMPPPLFRDSTPPLKPPAPPMFLTPSSPTMVLTPPDKAQRMSTQAPHLPTSPVPMQSSSLPFNMMRRRRMPYRSHLEPIRECETPSGSDPSLKENLTSPQSPSLLSYNSKESGTQTDPEKIEVRALRSPSWEEVMSPTTLWSSSSDSELEHTMNYYSDSDNLSEAPTDDYRVFDPRRGARRRYCSPILNSDSDSGGHKWVLDSDCPKHPRRKKKGSVRVRKKQAKASSPGRKHVIEAKSKHVSFARPGQQSIDRNSVASVEKKLPTVNHEACSLHTTSSETLRNIDLEKKLLKRINNCVKHSKALVRTFQTIPEKTKFDNVLQVKKDAMEPSKGTKKCRKENADDTNVRVIRVPAGHPEIEVICEPRMTSICTKTKGKSKKKHLVFVGLLPTPPSSGKPQAKILVCPHSNVKRTQGRQSLKKKYPSKKAQKKRRMIPVDDSLKNEFKNQRVLHVSSERALLSLSDASGSSISISMPKRKGKAKDWQPGKSFVSLRSDAKKMNKKETKLCMKEEPKSHRKRGTRHRVSNFSPPRKSHLAPSGTIKKKRRRLDRQIPVPYHGELLTCRSWENFPYVIKPQLPETPEANRREMVNCKKKKGRRKANSCSPTWKKNLQAEQREVCHSMKKCTERSDWEKAMELELSRSPPNQLRWEWRRPRVRKPQRQLAGPSHHRDDDREVHWDSPMSSSSSDKSFVTSPLTCNNNEDLSRRRYAAAKRAAKRVRANHSERRSPKWKYHHSKGSSPIKPAFIWGTKHPPRKRRSKVQHPVHVAATTTTRKRKKLKQFSGVAGRTDPQACTGMPSTSGATHNVPMFIPDLYPSTPKANERNFVHSPEKEKEVYLMDREKTKLLQTIDPKQSIPSFVQPSTSDMSPDLVHTRTSQLTWQGSISDLNEGNYLAMNEDGTMKNEKVAISGINEHNTMNFRHDTNTELRDSRVPMQSDPRDFSDTNLWSASPNRSSITTRQIHLWNVLADEVLQQLEQSMQCMPQAAEEEASLPETDRSPRWQSVQVSNSDRDYSDQYLPSSGINNPSQRCSCSRHGSNLVCQRSNDEWNVDVLQSDQQLPTEQSQPLLAVSPTLSAQLDESRTSMAETGSEFWPSSPLSSSFSPLNVSSHGMLNSSVNENEGLRCQQQDCMLKDQVSSNGESASPCTQRSSDRLGVLKRNKSEKMLVTDRATLINMCRALQSNSPRPRKRLKPSRKIPFRHSCHLCDSNVEVLPKSRQYNPSFSSAAKNEQSTFNNCPKHECLTDQTSTFASHSGAHPLISSSESSLTLLSEHNQVYDDPANHNLSETNDSDTGMFYDCYHVARSVNYEMEQPDSSSNGTSECRYPAPDVEMKHSAAYVNVPQHPCTSNLIKRHVGNPDQSSNKSRIKSHCKNPDKTHLKSSVKGTNKYNPFKGHVKSLPKREVRNPQRSTVRSSPSHTRSPLKSNGKSTLRSKVKNPTISHVKKPVKNNKDIHPRTISPPEREARGRTWSRAPRKTRRYSPT